MSRIGKKPIPMPAGVKYTVTGNTALVEGPKGKVTALIPAGISLTTKDGQLMVERQPAPGRHQTERHGIARGERANGD